MTLPRIGAEVFVTGEKWEPANLTAVLGIQPSYSRAKGTPLVQGRKEPAVRETEWIYEVAMRECDSIEPLVAEVLAPFIGKRDVFVGFLRRENLSVDIVCAVEIYDERPLLSLSSGLVEVIASLSASLSLDLCFCDST